MNATVALLTELIERVKAGEVVRIEAYSIVRKPRLGWWRRILNWLEAQAHLREPD